ncbi:MAG: efflux RND transporter periplasmic adaptor subunit [Planctomycetota bacterium]|jgi:RND family efflux transporter MFP subunit
MKLSAGGFGKALGGLIGVAAIVLVLAWLMGVFHEKTPPGETRRQAVPLPVGAETLVVEAVEVEVTESAVGTVNPVHRVSVGSKLLARVTAMHVEKAGEAVEADQVLVELDDADLRASLADAEAARDAAVAQKEQAEVDLARIRVLYEKNVEPESALDAAETHLRTQEAGVTRAEQAVEFARTRLEYAKILAPISGIVIDKHAEEGDLVSPGQVLVTLYDPARMQLIARVRESLAARLRPGADVDVSIEALDQRCTGVIDQIVPEAEAESRVFEVRVSGPCPPGVYSGMFGRLHVPVGSRREIRIPDEAVRRVGQMEMAFVVVDGALQRRFVQTGRRAEGQVEVLAGLTEGEEILARARDARP